MTFNKGDDAHGYNGKVFAFISILELVIVSVYAIAPNWYKYLLPFWYIEMDILKWTGLFLLMLSLVVVWLAQSHMRESWRIGIDEMSASRES